MPNMTVSVRNAVRTLLRIRVQRVVPRRSPRPALGAKVFCGDLRMSVQAGLSAELWAWLQERGWREVLYRPDRRRYRDIPSAWVTELFDSDPERRQAVLDAATANAIARQGSQRRT